MGNPVVHFEIAGPDGPALQQFYRDLFGWNVEVAGEEMGFYGVVQANEGGIGGGIFQTDGDMPPISLPSMSRLTTSRPPSTRYPPPAEPL